MVAEAEQLLDVLSEKLLRDCVRKSAIVSTSAEFGPDIAHILRAMRTEAETSEQKHNENQRTLLGNAARVFSSMAALYRN
jgi:translation initiation factor IF-2